MVIGIEHRIFYRGVASSSFCPKIMENAETLNRIVTPSDNIDKVATWWFIFIYEYCVLVENAGENVKEFLSF